MKFFKSNENGRSMLEILGVLAVIGVLSIAGISGYKYGITKYQVNELIYDVNILAQDIRIYLEKSEYELPENLTQVQSRVGQMLEARLLENDYFEIALNSLPQSLCKGLLTSGWTLPIEIYVGTQKYNGQNLCISETSPRFSFVFAPFETNSTDGILPSIPKNDRCEADKECSQCESCKNNICVVTKPLKIGNNCYACDTRETVRANQTQCDACPNRIYTKSMWIEYCLLPEDVDDCSGKQGSACDLPDGKEYKGMCTSGKCVDLGVCPSGVTGEMAKNWCATQGGTASVAELSALASSITVTAETTKCKSSSTYLTYATNPVCPSEDELSLYAGKASQTTCGSGAIWTAETDKRYPDYFQVNLSNGDILNYNYYVYTAKAFCKNFLP